MSASMQETTIHTEAANLFNTLHEMYHVRPFGNRDYGLERERSIQLNTILRGIVPQEIRRLLAEYDAADDRHYRAYYGVRDLLPYLNKDVIALKAARSEAWDAYDTALRSWFDQTIGRPMHDHEPGVFLVLFKTR